ncbi:MAG: hypothetical protein RBT72_01905 [Spirochaetia bacterium]|jgi:hypothetical protein|nr:hypothetical protein [Spirochaetales bacterium]MDX9783490.1 hypothetical protein [Spirochaetia bacterium]
MSKPSRPLWAAVFFALFLFFGQDSSLLRAQNADSETESATAMEKGIDILVPSAGVIVDFGVPKRFDLTGGSYLGGGVQVQSRTLDVPASGEGILLFSQQQDFLQTSFPRSRDNLIALAHPSGFVSVYSSPSLSFPDGVMKNEVTNDQPIGSIGTARGTADASYYLRIADTRSRLLVNPALFATSMIDRAAPRIEEVSLIRDGFELKAELARRLLQRLAQGDYRLAVRLYDPSYAGGVVSGLFRIKIVLDGQVVADRKFDSAQNTDQGLGFLGLQAPSFQLADNDGRFLLGSRFLARGNHSLELTVYDFNGNAGSFLWRFIVE